MISEDVRRNGADAEGLASVHLRGGGICGLPESTAKKLKCLGRPDQTVLAVVVEGGIQGRRDNGTTAHRKQVRPTLVIDDARFSTRSAAR